MMKVSLFITILTVISILPLTSAFTITEVELNPNGSDSGNEWIKLYSKNFTNITNLEITTNNDNLILNGSLALQGTCLLTFDSQFLDNNDEIITLKNGTQELDQTTTLIDTNNDNRTWQFNTNSSNWTFADNILPLPSDCTLTIAPPPPAPQNTTNQTEQNTTDEDNEDEDNETEVFVPSFIPANTNTNIEPDEPEETKGKIVLNAPTKATAKTKETFISRKEQTALFLLISFSVFTIIIIILLALRKL